MEKRDPHRRLEPLPSGIGPAAATGGACGVYVHVPFCERRCAYCDFFSTTEGAPARAAYVTALTAEAALRAPEVKGRRVATLYVGGGTPSLLGGALLGNMMAQLRRSFPLADDAEVTLEANPDDVTPQLAAQLVEMGVNRVSLGIQTFDDACLRLLGRRHTGAEAVAAVECLAKTGFDNLSVDLIYGLPGQTLAQWQADVARALSLPVAHLSAYALTYEAGTRLTAWRDTGRVAEADEELSLAMFAHLIDATEAAGMKHYELSNFARPGRHSRHNAAYWDGTPYVGLGPGAHSYDGAATRRRNLPRLAAYLSADGGDVPHEVEHLSAGERCDERVMLSLRTSQGLDMAALERDFGWERAEAVRRGARRHLQRGLLEQRADRLVLTRRGLFLADFVTRDLMLAAE